MGPVVDLWCLQPRSRGMFCHLLHPIPRPLTETTQICYLMVRWIFDVLGLIRCGYGPYELCLPSLLDSSTAVHCGLLWLYHVNTCFCLEASQHDSHFVLRPCSARLLGLVLDQLFPYGIYWLTLCLDVWRETSSGLDDRLESDFGLRVKTLIRSVY
jgi:hypothetical protein